MSEAFSARPCVHLLPGRDRRVREGHPWVYSNEVRMDTSATSLVAGSVVRVAAGDGTVIGSALFNPHTLISLRMLTREPNQPIDRPFLVRRLERALLLREMWARRPYYRLVHAEADGLPGLIVDRFGDTVVIQVNSAGMELLLVELLGAIDDVLAPSAVVLRNDSGARRLEGLAEDVRVVKGVVEPPLAVEENGLTFYCDPVGGQKTGWFYDQRENRAAVAALCSGARVLDVFGYTGGFAIACARAGAVSVLSVDRSQAALDFAAQAAAANGYGHLCLFRRADAFAEMTRLDEGGQRFDVVIADPPAFVKAKKDLAVGLRAYRKLTRQAAKLTASDGFLCIASCSHSVPVERFAEAVAQGLRDAGREGRIIRQSGAACDHPVHPFLPESAYLKCQIVALD